MSRIVLVTNAAHDLPTNYLDTWSEKIATKAGEYPDIQIFDLKGVNANRSEFEKMLVEKQPRLILFHGHGSGETIHGYNLEVLVKQDENASLLSGKIIHALSCETGKTLGPTCIQVGASAYVGYKENFKFVHVGKYENNRAEDKIAALFLDPAFEVAIALLEGVSAKEAFERSQKKYIDNIRILLDDKNPIWAQSVLPTLFHNLTHQVHLGDGDAVF